MSPTGIDPDATLGELVAERPARADLFERLKLDYCCGGARTLADACARQALDVETVRRTIGAFDAAPAALSAHIEENDWRRASIDELCEHIVAVHHDGLRRELPRIAELLASVMRVHGPVHPELRDLPRVFGGLREELETHLESEEREVFPACRAVAAGDRSRADELLLADHEDDHLRVGDALAVLRELTTDYDTAHALCRTHRRLLEGLRDLEVDLHRHIHEENNILFPRVRATVPDEPGLLPCCRGWIGEQTHRHAAAVNARRG